MSSIGLLTSQLLCWFTSAVVSTLVNKLLVASLNSPITLTLVHLVCSVVFDYLLLRVHQLDCTVQYALILDTLPIGVMLAAGKWLTYLSYEYISASLTHTLKSSSPIFSAVVSVCLFGKNVRMNGSSYAALLVIAVGITLSTVNEVQVNFIGLVAALVSTMTAVLHGALLKKVIMKRPEEHVFQLHYHTTITSMIIMIPYVFFMDSEIFIVSNIESFAKGFPGLLILISVVTQYMQTVFSTLALSQISVVSHQVANTLKRLIVIVVSLMYFKNAINFSNAFGICMALSGFLMYGITMINSDGSSSRRDLCSIRDIWSSRKEPNKDIAVFTVTNTNGGKDVENWGLARDNDEKN